MYFQMVHNFNAAPASKPLIFIRFISYRAKKKVDHFNSNTTTEKGGSFTFNEFPLKAAPVNV